ncbi:MAG TPA: alpha/beta hydrolase [Candidatus Binataceae bacterium]|nr:alpha/beta hydrolase [Candidatus Binataceae bacterium]
MSLGEPHSHIFDAAPRLHYLEWNPAGLVTVILLHGNSANAWWWEPVARLMPPEVRMLALDQRGHGDSEWVRPAAYSPLDYARDIAAFTAHAARPGRKPVVVGHSMGGISTLAFARNHGELARAVAAIDVAIKSSKGRDRYIRRLKALPTVTYADLETAQARFRLMPDEGAIAPEILLEIAHRSLARTDEGRWTLKFDRESFFGSDGIDVIETIRAIAIPTLLVRAEHSRIMTADSAAAARDANPHVRLVEIAAAHHHVILENPAAVASTITEFIAQLP